jgi:CrcB protein
MEMTRRVETVGAGTLLVNVVGAFVLGVVAGVFEARFPDAPRWVIGGLGIGILGGFTTFSTYMLDAVHQLEGGRYALAVGYVVGSVVLGLSVAFLGVWLGRQGG